MDDGNASGPAYSEPEVEIYAAGTEASHEYLRSSTFRSLQPALPPRRRLVPGCTEHGASHVVS